MLRLSLVGYRCLAAARPEVGDVPTGHRQRHPRTATPPAEPYAPTVSVFGSDLPDPVRTVSIDDRLRTLGP
ncbi:hypothetical protein A4U64_12990 [Rhodococcus sp. WB1]|nr:hypothetical protein A4U64_12990 [Rhodococcus sp. WB1]OLL17522.1 hypothetical protein BKE56_019875 [Rhodococcus sp. M8]PND53536.1 hypothetical protein CQZ88_02860 [Rhodococcus sp. ENV425]